MNLKKVIKIYSVYKFKNIKKQVIGLKFNERYWSKFKNIKAKHKFKLLPFNNKY